MAYPKTGQEVYVSLNLSNTMLTGIGKGTITREDVSADYLKRLFAERGIAPPERDTWPVLCLAGRPAAVWRVGIDQKALPECSGNTIYITITKNNGG